jgi:cation transport ATPase
MAQRQAYGQSVVYFGDCQLEPDLAAMADVAVTVANQHYQVTAAAPIVFLSPDLAKFESLHSLSQKRNAQVKSAVALAALPNVAAIAAAVFFNRTSVGLCHYDNAGRSDLLPARFPRFKASIGR